MLYQLPLFVGGCPAGCGEYEELGLRVRFRCFLTEKELCKLYLVRGSCRLLLGTPIPVGSGLCLERTLTKSELERAGVWPPERVEAVNAMGQGAWREVTGQMPAIADPALSRLFRQGGWRWKHGADGIVLCHPWQSNTPFPAMPVFCFVRMERECVLCWLDGEGSPCFPPEQGRWEGEKLDSCGLM